MGDPRRLRKKFSKPSHPWQKQRIDEEVILMKEYGFKNKTELWKLGSLLKKYKLQVKELIPRRDDKAESEKKQLLAKLFQFKLVKQDSIPEDILAITLKDLCERRLQTVVFKKGLARSVKQSRQFIIHEHIMIGDRKITAPSYIVNDAEEVAIRFADSALASEDHPERVMIQKELKVEMNAAGLKENTAAPVAPANAEKAKRKPRKSGKQEMTEEVKREKKEEAKEEAEGDSE